MHSFIHLQATNKQNLTLFIIIRSSISNQLHIHRSVEPLLKSRNHMRKNTFKSSLFEQSVSWSLFSGALLYYIFGLKIIHTTVVTVVFFKKIHPKIPYVPGFQCRKPRPQRNILWYDSKNQPWWKTINKLTTLRISELFMVWTKQLHPSL